MRCDYFARTAVVAAHAVAESSILTYQEQDNREKSRPELQSALVYLTST